MLPLFNSELMMAIAESQSFHIPSLHLHVINEKTVGTLGQFLLIW